MKETKELRYYLITRFFMTLIGVGVAQIAVNLGMRTFIMPKLEEVTGLDGFLSGKSLTEAIRVFWSCLVMLVLRYGFGNSPIVAGLLNSRLVHSVLGDTMVESIVDMNRQISASGLGLLALKVVILFFILVALWALPFAIGASIYSKRVSDRINELERERVEREREYEKRRNLLLSDITHDIKTPITTMAGFSRALSDGTVPEDQRQEYLDAMYNKSMKVSELVSLLFEYIKLDSQGYVLNKTDTDFCELVRECVAGSYAEFESRGIEPVLIIPDSVITLNLDKMQIERAINNLLSNTVKHNSDGTNVTISVERDGEDVVFRVSDNGVLIDKDDAMHIFEPFVRGDKSRKSGEGNGLGLSISKRIVELHGGKIILTQYVSSGKHEFTKSFEIRLPV